MPIPLGWVGWELDQRRKEKVVVAWVEEMGGTIGAISAKNDERSWWEKTKDNWFGESVTGVILYFTKESDLSPLLELKNLKSIDLSDTQVSEEQVQELRQALPNCEISF